MSNVSVDIAKAVVTLIKKGGRGVLVGVNLILTAAHCIDFECSGGMVLGDHYIEEIETAQGQLKVSPLAVEPVSDIAVLGSPDDQIFPKESMAFGSFCQGITPVPLCLSDFELGRPNWLGNLSRFLDPKVSGFSSCHILLRRILRGPKTGKRIGIILGLFGHPNFELFQKVPVYIYSHAGTWIKGSAMQCSPNTQMIWVEAEEKIEGGASGGPIINEKGELVGIVSNFSEIINVQRDNPAGYNPCPHLTLPVWAIRRILEG